MAPSDPQPSIPEPRMSDPSKAVVVCALYRFVRLDDYRELRAPLLALLQQHAIGGSLLLAPEGINGTVSGSRTAIDTLLAWLRRDTRLAPLEVKESLTDKVPFLRARVKLKKEIVTLGVPGIDPNRSVGTYVEPADWNALISDPEVLLVDTRNDYEVRVGSFRNAVNPQTRSFREFPHYVRQHLDPSRHRKVAMFCTGGIRCEKSTALLRQLGFEQVYHLKGGILKYLEQVPEQESLWQGECFVFDERVTVNHRLQPGSYVQCNACRMPVSSDDLSSPDYQPGISCPHCKDTTSREQRERFAERQKQMRLARERGEHHIGAAAMQAMQENREAKRLKKQLMQAHSARQNTRHR
jgi:UPF0176 protein